MKEEIIEVAEQQMKEGGYAQLNFGEIATVLCTTRANLHYHFKNKASLAKAATLHYISNDKRRLEYLAKAHPNNFRGFMYALEDGVLQHIKKYGSKSPCVCMQLLRNRRSTPNELYALSVEYQQYHLSFLESEIEKSKDSGAIKDRRNSRVIAREAYAIVIGTFHMAAMAEDDPNHELPYLGTLKSWVDNL